jgi:uncharacterized RDD family membrane protein YckC
MGAQVETGNETFVIRTPEHVQLEYVLAGLGSRAAAFLLDTALRVILVACIFFAVILFAEWIPRWVAKDLASGPHKNWILALGFLAYGLIDLGYFMIFEALWSGQTPGKRRQGIRVIKADGRPVGWLDSAVRNILRAVDMFVGVYPLGLVFMFFSRNNQRLGDYAAGTIVVVERRDCAPVKLHRTRSMQITHPDVAIHVSRLGVEQYQVLKSFLERREEMDPPHRQDLARLLIQQIIHHTGMDKGVQSAGEPLIEEVVMVYEQRKRAI